MNKPASKLTITAALLIGGASLLFADTDRVVPPWERGEKRSPRASDTRPSAVVPQALRRAEVSSEPQAVETRHAEARTGRSQGTLERRVIADARRAAEAQVAGPGVANYFRVGFYQGLQDALRDDRIGRRDFRQGIRHGERDREAQRIGRDLGSDAAFDLAQADAERAVADQFRDLTRDPAFLSDTIAPVWAAPRVPFEAPTLASLFDEFPISRFSALGRDFDLYLDDWGWDAARLYGCSSYVDFYSRDWDSANRAFRVWIRDTRNARLLRGLNEAAQQRIRGIFAEAFVRRIDRLAATRLDRAWSAGLDRGWDYGAFIHEERDYRAGFARGFRQEAGLVAKTVFAAAYPREFETAYGDAFDRWSNTAVPAIGRITLADGNDDGVFEPGERVLADIEMINFGGAVGRVPTRLDGAALSEIDAKTARLEPRSAEIWKAWLQVSLDDTIRPRTTTQLTVTVGAETKTVALDVRRPLEWVEGSLRLQRDNLEGRVRVDVDVRNLSRRERIAQASLVTRPADLDTLVQDLGTVAAQGTTRVRFDIDGLSALDLVGGRVALDLFLDTEGVEQDSLNTRLAGTATDLSSRDLARLLRIKAAEGATPVEAAQLRELVLRRLRVDWRSAVRANGNPYKRDYRSGGDVTALGELVQLSSSLTRDPATGELLDGLSSDVLRLARDLPGPHPLLRKYVKRLARRLP